MTTIEIQRGCFDLGLSIVGGCDTPLVCVVIQEVFPDGVVAKDGRLQAGDQLLEVWEYIILKILCISIECHKSCFLFLIPYFLFSDLIIFLDDPMPFLSCVNFISNENHT